MQNGLIFRSLSWLSSKAMALENTGFYSLLPSFLHSPSPSSVGQRCTLDTSYQGRGPFQISCSLVLCCGSVWMPGTMLG